MKRAILAILAVSWFLAVLDFWRACPPLVTVVAESSSARLHIMGFDREGNVILGRMPVAAGRSRAGSAVVSGPLTLHNPGTGRELATLTTSEAPVRQLRIDLGQVVTGDPWNVQVRAFGKEEPLVQATADAKLFSTLSPAGGGLLVHAGEMVTIHDVQTGNVLWTKDGVAKARWAGESAVAVKEKTNPLTTSIVDARTGHQRLTTGVGYPEPHEGELSPDGRYVWWAGAIHSDDPPGLYDVTAGQRLWGLEQPSMSQFTPVQSRYFYFSDDSTELQAQYATQGDRFEIASWRVRDGRPIHEPPPKASLLAKQHQGTTALSVNGRWRSSEFSRAMFKRNLIPNAAWKWMIMNSPRLLRTISVAFSPTSYTRLTEVSTGKIVAEVPRLSSAVIVEPGDKGFLFHGGMTVTRVDLPPRPDYWWLIQYGILPPVALIGFAEFWRRKRRAAAMTGEGSGGLTAGAVRSLIEDALHRQNVCATESPVPCCYWGRMWPILSRLAFM